MTAAIKGSLSSLLTETPSKKCNQCSKAGEVGKELLRCGRCKEAFYCDKDCQTKHWKVHKPNCQKPAEVQKTQMVVKDYVDTKDDGKVDKQGKVLFYDISTLPKEFAAELTKVFAKHRVEVAREPFCYGSPHDFGRQIKLLFISTDKVEEASCPPHPNVKDQINHLKKINDKDVSEGLDFSHFVSGIKTLADSLGFQVKTSCLPSYPRDHFLLLPSTFLSMFSVNGEALKGLQPNDPVVLADSVCSWSNLALRQNAQCFTRHNFFDNKTSTLNTYSKQYFVVYDLATNVPQNRLTMFPFTIEGGNCFFATNKQGQTVCLLGGDSFNQVLMEFILKGYFKDPGKELPTLKGLIPQWMKEYVEVLGKRLSGDHKNLRMLANEMYLKGLLPFKGKKGVLDSATALNLCKTNQNVVDEAIEQGLIPFPDFTEKDLENPKIIEFAAQKGILMDKILPHCFGVDRPICIIPQLGYHLDTFLTPGPAGTLFVQSYKECEEVLGVIKKHAKELGLSSKELVILDNYLKTAAQLGTELSHLHAQVNDSLTEAGFTIIPTPGVFFDKSTETDPQKVQSTFNCNFINGLAGFSKKAGTFYYITGGAKVHDKLGQALMGAFKEHLISYVPNIKVHFIQGGMALWNKIANQSGLHCMTSEWEVEAQTVSLSGHSS